MSIGNIVTRGFGPNGSISAIVTGGYSIGDNVVISNADAEKIARFVWKEVLDSSYQAKELMRVIASACAGKASGLQPDVGVPKYRDLGDTKDRITAKTDRFGNRTDITLDVD